MEEVGEGLSGDNLVRGWQTEVGCSREGGSMDLCLGCMPSILGLFLGFVLVFVCQRKDSGELS